LFENTAEKRMGHSAGRGLTRCANESKKHRSKLKAQLKYDKVINRRKL